MVEEDRTQLILSIRRETKQNRHIVSSTIGKGERIPLGDGIFTTWGYNGDGDFLFTIMSSDCNKELDCSSTLHIKDKDGTAKMEGFVDQGDEIGDRQIYFSDRQLTDEEREKFGPDVIVRPALEVSDQYLRDFRSLLENPKGNLELAKALLQKLKAVAFWSSEAVD